MQLVGFLMMRPIYYFGSQTSVAILPSLSLYQKSRMKNASIGCTNIYSLSLRAKSRKPSSLELLLIQLLFVKKQYVLATEN